MTARSVWLLLVLLAASLTMNVALGSAYLRSSAGAARAHVDRPAQAQREARASSQQAEQPILAAGAELPALGAMDLTGKRMPLDLRGRPTILYVFSRNCGWCERNLRNVRQLVATQRETYRIVALSVGPDGPEDVKRYLAEKDLSVETYINADYVLLQELGLGTTPHTIVSNTSGRVLRSWLGAFVGPLEREMGQFFDIGFPGL